MERKPQEQEAAQVSGVPLVRPVSATHGAVAASGLAGFLAAVFLLRVTNPFGADMVASALFVMIATAVAVFLPDLLWRKVHLRASTGLDFAHDDPSWGRTLTKCAGLAGTLGFLAFLFWLFPEYRGGFYDRFYTLLRIVLPVWLLLALPYFHWVDRHMPAPRDGYWHVGRLVMGRWREVDHAVVVQHVLGWLIKGFFLPLMFTYLCNDLGKFLMFDFRSLTSFKAWFDFLFDTLFFIDVGLAAMGYLMCLRITDTQVRSAEPTLLGWTAALVCYEPFWSLFGRHYLAYHSDYQWGAWLWDTPTLYAVWGSTILMLIAIYVWATVIFGARFSNLTHRGIITNGPYRYTKHPAYVAKGLTWWMISVPFVAQVPAHEALRLCLLLLGVNLIYLLRAKTEEWHLSRDPDYVQYALWIEQNGIFRCIRRLPLVRAIGYKAPGLAT